MIISKINALEILDSRGNPTLQTIVELENGIKGIASVPSGASTGIHEAWELRDHDKNRYNGLGVKKAIRLIQGPIFQLLKGETIFFQEEIDKKLINIDGTLQKQIFGANTLLSVSLACARAGAIAKNVELFVYLRHIFKFPNEKKIPVPIFNLLNGGKHGDTNIDFQEFHVIPFGLKEKGFSEMLRAGSEIFHAFGAVLKERGFDTDIGDEGGYAPDMESTIQALDLLMAAIARAGYEAGKEIFLGSDVGSSVLYDTKQKKYIFSLDRGILSSTDLVGLYNEWLCQYPFMLIEDGLSEDDWEGWKIFTSGLGSKLILVGDDIFCTNIKRIQKGVDEKIANAVIIKPNQIGTLSETMNAIRLAKTHDYKNVISHRSGETLDSFIADLAVASGADFIKAGAPSRGERVAKYNRLLEIESLFS